jgi:hypothetical protein
MLSACAGIGSCALGEDRVDPEGCMRSLTAEALLWAYPQGPLFAVSLGVMAVANAFVMLGLLPKPLAEAILAEHRSELERQGFGDSWGVTRGELTVRPGADGYWQSRTGGLRACGRCRCWWQPLGACPVTGAAPQQMRAPAASSGRQCPRPASAFG